MKLFYFFSSKHSRPILGSFLLCLLFSFCYVTSGHVHKHRSRSRNRTPAHSAQPLIAEQPSLANGPGSSSSPGLVASSLECDYLSFKQNGCEDEVGSQCDAGTGKCVCKPSHPVRLLDFCLPVSKLNGPCYTSGQCSNVLNASCYIFGKEYDLETASGGHNLGRQVKNWPLGICKCRLGFAFNETSGNCEKRLVGSWCSNDKHCLLRSLNSICDKKRGECECSWGTSYDFKLDACVPIPIKPTTGKSSSTNPVTGVAGIPGLAVDPLPPLLTPRILYLAKCESENDCDPTVLGPNERLPSTSRLYQRPTNGSISGLLKKQSKHTGDHEHHTKSHGPRWSSARSRSLGRLSCVRGRCICSTGHTWEANACREEWNEDSGELRLNGTHHGRTKGEETKEDEFYDETTIGWQTITFMIIVCAFVVGVTFRFCYYRKSEEDELAEDLRTAEALFAHKAAMGPQHPFNALTAAFLSKPAPGPASGGPCGADYKSPYGYHAPAGCYHHEPYEPYEYGYNYGMCGASGGMMIPPNSAAAQHQPPLNEHDEDEYLKQEAAEQEAAKQAAASLAEEGQSSSDKSKPETEIGRNSASPSSSINGRSLKATDSLIGESGCGQQLGTCGPNGCCGCECLLVVNHPPPVLTDCCGGPLSGPCRSAACPTLNAPNAVSSDSSLAKDLKELAQAEERIRADDKNISAEREDDSEETGTDDPEDDDKVAILKNTVNLEFGASGISSSNGGVTGSLGRTLCSTAAGLVRSQLGGSNRNDRKVNRRTSSCSSSSASLLNCSSSSDSATSGPTDSDPLSSGSVQPETVHLLVFSDSKNHVSA